MTTSKRLVSETQKSIATLSVVIPGDIEKVSEHIGVNRAMADGHEWYTAAMVYAWTYDEGRGRPRKMLKSEHLLTIAEFAKLGIRGLTSRNTVAKYRKTMQSAIDAGHCAEPVAGQPFDLPDIEWESMKSLPANYSSESNEWYTPIAYIDAARDALGDIDLDPASCEQAQEWIQAGEYFTQADNALTKDWFGRVWLNPPYGTDAGESVAGQFCMKAIEQFESGNVESVIVLVNSLHSQRWQAPMWKYPVCLVDHRIKFVSGNGEQNENPTFQNAFFYLGKDLKGFKRAFKDFGYIVRPA